VPPRADGHAASGGIDLCKGVTLFLGKEPVSEGGKARGELLNAILASPGMEHVNTSHHRTFSLNIFRMNAQELIEIASRVNDPNEGLRLMSQDNREASQQTHRELARRVHNFVAAALTLVEHTRVFMREHYANTPLLTCYQDKVNAELANNPVVRFVQDLRNLMLHKGLPESEMYLHFQSNPDAPSSGGVLTTGIHIRASKLLEWDGWTPPARAFIEASGEFVDIRTFAREYTDKIVAFQDWLQGELNQLHAGDLKQLRALQIEMGKFDTPSSQLITAPEAHRQNIVEPEGKYEFAARRRSELDAAGDRLLKKVRKIDLPGQGDDGFPGERPVGATIFGQDIVEEPLFWGNDTAGRRVFVFIYKDGAVYGLDESIFAEVQTIVEGVLKSDWATKTLSRSFIEKIATKWLQSKFKDAETGSLSEAVATASARAVKPLELWAPIAFLEVQSSFALGPAEITTISKAKIDALEAELFPGAPGDREKISQLFDQIRERMQGLAAVVYRMDAEPGRIKEEGEAIARIAVGLLRFFSPAAVNFPAVCANALLGSEIVPSSHLLVRGDGTFSYTEGTLIPNVPGWRLSTAALGQMRPALDAIGKLVRPDGLTHFALSVRSSVTLFGTGATFANPIERLTYSLSALEAVLLRHSAEPVEFNVAERIGSLIAQEGAASEDVTRNVREAYRLRARRDIAPLTQYEMGSVAAFLRLAHQIIRVALGNADRFGTVAEFVASLDSVRHQRAQSEG
jgi:hypothetical protein